MGRSTTTRTSVESARSDHVARAGSHVKSEAAPHQQIRVLCVDDHELLVEGLKTRFAIEGGIEVVGWLGTAERLTDEVGRLQPDVVVLDIEMPGPDAFEMADRMIRKYPNVRVVVLSAHVRDAFVSASFRAGVSAYYAKSDELADIVRGVYEVALGKAGSFVLGPKVRERCKLVPGRQAPRGGWGRADDGPAHAAPPMTALTSLTPREGEILRLIGKGLTRTQIGAQLCRSAKTVDAHQGRMMKKLGLTARADLMRLAIREGLAQA